MASAVPTFPSCKETTNFARLSRLLVDVGARVLRNKFDSICPPARGLHTHLALPLVHATLKSLRKKRILNPSQWIKLFPTTPSSVCSEHFDITLLVVLLRNICGLTPPLTGWDNLPPAADTTVEADIARVKYYRNSVYGHATQASVDDSIFNSYWQDIRDPLVRLGGAGYGTAIDNLKNDCMDPVITDHYIELLKQWKKDDDSIKDKLDEIAEKISKIDDQVKDSTTKPLDLNHCQDQLRSLYNTMSQVKITPWDKDNTVHINEVYTQLSWLRDEKKPSGTTQDKLQDYSEIFEGDKNYGNPKRILVYGRPGIGKSTFSKKIAVDWSSGEREILKKFDILLMVKLRDVCDLEDFRGVLKAADLLSADGLTSVDSLYDYVRQNQERVLLVLDGYDEYHCSAKKSSAVFKMWKGSQLRDCYMVMTTRPVKADELKKFSHVQSEIRGFDTKDQVKKFARKFLTEKNEVNIFADYLSEKKLWELAEIPLLLLMLCLLWKKRDSEGLPTSRLDLYQRFVQTLLYHVQEKESCDSFRTVDECKDELTAIGKLAFEALLSNSLHFRSSDLPSHILSEKFVRVGLFQISKLSSVDPQEEVVFVHKSFQEYLAACFIVHESDSAAIDSLRKVEALEEVLKFACEWSEEGLRAVLCHLGLVGSKEGLTDYKFTETPSDEDLTEDQKKFLGVVLDCFISSPASGKPEMYSLLLTSVKGVLLIYSHHLLALAEKHLLKSTSLLNFVFFKRDPFRGYSFPPSIMDDVDALVVTSAGEMKASGLVKRYGETMEGMFPFLKKEDGKVCLYFSYLEERGDNIVDLLRELVTLSLPENIGGTTNQTRHHCLKFLKIISINYRQLTSESIEVFNDVLPLVSNPRFIAFRGILPSAEASEVESIMSRININSNLSKLELLECNLKAEAASVVATSLHQAPNLRHLDLSGNPLCSGVNHLAKNLHHVPQLSFLRLSCVSMGDRESCSLASSLTYVPRLNVLDLSTNQLRNGVTDLANHLNSVPLLTKLYLNDTRMGEEEAGALARALKYIPHLELLGVRSNPLGRGVGVLIQHLSSVPMLQWLYLKGVQMTKREVDVLTTAGLAHGTRVVSGYHDYRKRRRYSEEELKKRGVKYDVEGQMNSKESDETPKPQYEWPSPETGSEDEMGPGSEDEMMTGFLEEYDWGNGSEDERGDETEDERGDETEDERGDEAEDERGDETEDERETESEDDRGDESEDERGDESENERGDETEDERGDEAEDERGDESEDERGDETEDERGHESEDERGDETEDERGDETEDERGDESEDERETESEDERGDESEDERGDESENERGDETEDERGDETEDERGDEAEDERGDEAEDETGTGVLEEYDWENRSEYERETESEDEWDN